MPPSVDEPGISGQCGPDARDSYDPPPAVPDADAARIFEEPQAKTLVEQVAEVTGMDHKRVKRYLNSGKSLTEDQLLLLARSQVAFELVNRINKLKPEQVAAVIGLIAGGCGAK